VFILASTAVTDAHIPTRVSYLLLDIHGEIEERGKRVDIKTKILIFFHVSALDCHSPAYEQTIGLVESFLWICELH